MELTQHHPLSYQQAMMICQEHQQFLGVPFDDNTPGKGNIVCITPAPHDEARQWQFAQFYRECQNAERALQFYKGTAFIPMILAFPVIRKRGVFYQDLREFVRAKTKREYMAY